jgi:hypothetical protein
VIENEVRVEDETNLGLGLDRKLVPNRHRQRLEVNTHPIVATILHRISIRRAKRKTGIEKVAKKGNGIEKEVRVIRIGMNGIKENEFSLIKR